MLIMATTEVEISMVFACSGYNFNLFARWYQRLWFEKWRLWGDMIGVEVWKF